MQSNKILNSSLLILTFIGLASFIVAFISVLQINDDTKEFDKIKKISTISEEIRYYDEVLTMSARVATLNQNDYWIKRYYENINPLENSINEAIKLMPSLKDKFKSIEKVNKKLISLEEKALDLSKKGNYKQAENLLFSLEYKNLKQSYIVGLDSVLSEIEKKNKTLQNHLFVNINFSSFVILFSILFMMVIFYFIFKELLNKSKYVNHILDSQNAIIFITDGKRLKVANKTALEFFKCKTQEHLKKKFLFLSDTFTKGENYLSGKDWLLNAFAFKNKILKIKIDNKIFQINISKDKIDDVNYVVSLVDITELTQLQTQLQKTVDIQVEDIRKKDLTLIAQSKMATMGEMIENIAHQWKQPLSIITLSSTGVKMESEFNELTDDYLQNALTNIEKSANYLSQTIDDFKDFFKNDSLKQQYVLEEAFNKSKTLIASKLEKRDIHIITSFDSGTIYGNKNEIIQVFMNLLSNSIDAFDEFDLDTKVIYFSTRYEKEFVVIKFCDNAGGIPSAIISKIFEYKFSTKGENGTGIGLYMSKLIIDKIDGQIQVKNSTFTYEQTEYKGVEFTIKLPLKEPKGSFMQ